MSRTQLRVYLLAYDIRGMLIRLDKCKPLQCVNVVNMGLLVAHDPHISPSIGVRAELCGVCE